MIDEFLRRFTSAVSDLEGLIAKTVVRPTVRYTQGTFA